MTPMFPQIIPSRDKCLTALRDALEAEGTRIYIDASILIHCYEMNALASEDLLAAFERYEHKVGVPTWAAKETWEYADTRIAKQPLKSSADRVRKELTRFRKEAGRYIDDDSLKDVSRDDYHRQLADSFDAATDLIKLVENHQPKADLTTKRLLPFIEGRLLKSDLNTIVDIVSRTAATRMTHRIPPGFSDTQPAEDNDDDARLASRGRGKQKNPHGDLIIWFEILQDCVRTDATNLVFVTRDVTKGDWAHVPKKILDENDRPQNNAGLVTLPQPLLIHEAKKSCATLQTVHVVSVEMLTHVLRSLRIEVSNLIAALQSGEADEEPTDDLPAPNRPEPNYVLKFDPGDMAYEPDVDNEVDSIIVDLQGEGWRLQNTAARRLEGVLGTATRDQRVQIGRGVVAAANDGALAPLEFLERVLSDKDGALPVRSDILIGALAETYISETGDLKKPQAVQGLVEIIFAHAGDTDLAQAYKVVMQRLEPQSRNYLLLPTDDDTAIEVELLVSNGSLDGVLHKIAPLVELDAPPNRQMPGVGRDLPMSINELLLRLAEEFAVPRSYLVSPASSQSEFIVPGNAGFVPWGPNTGTLLR
jgi:hypothetical protein